MRANVDLGEGGAYTSHRAHPTKGLLPGGVGFNQYRNRPIELKPGDHIYEQGSPAAEVFLIEGLASLVRYDQNLRHHSDPNSRLSMIVGFANTGKFMGLPEFFESPKGSGINYITSAIAEAPSRVLAFNHRVFKGMLRECPTLAEGVTQMLAEMSLKYLERANLNDRQKVAAYIMDLIRYSVDIPGSPVQHYSELRENGDGAVEIHKSQEQIAEATGTSRRFINRLFKEETIRELITTEQAKIRIPNPMALYEFLGYLSANPTKIQKP